MSSSTSASSVARGAKSMLTTSTAAKRAGLNQLSTTTASLFDNEEDKEMMQCKLFSNELCILYSLFILYNCTKK
jgi:hypothetical protein